MPLVCRTACFRAPVASLLVGLAPVAAAAPEDGRYDCIIEPERVVEVGSAAIGVLAEVRVRRSQRVHAGDVLAVLESGVEAASVAVARQRAGSDAEIRAREVTFELQTSNQRRSARLHATRAIPAQARDEAEHDARLSALRLRQAREDRRLAELELDRAERVLARRTITSPVDGVVTVRHRFPGERVEDQPIVTIARLDPLRVEVVLPAERYGDVQAGMTASVFPEHAGTGPYTATVEAVDAVLDAASGTFAVELSLPNPDYRLPGGLRCTLAFAPGGGGGVAPPETTASPPSAQSAAGPEPTPAAGSASHAASSVNAGMAALPASKPVPVSPPGTTDAVASQATPPPEATPAPVNVAAAACTAFGPYRVRAAAERARGALSDGSLEARLLEGEVSTLRGYLVVIHATDVAGGTPAVLAALARQGIRDVQVLRREPEQVSVGYFHRVEAAEARARQVNARGLPARVAPRMLPARGFFVELDRASADVVARASGLIRARGETVPGRAECQRIVTASR